jgi:hypothetical protein
LNEVLLQGIDGLTGEMSEVLVLSPVSHIHLNLNLGVSSMSFLQHQPDSTSQALCVHSIEFRLTQSTKQVVDRLVVGVEHVPRPWSEEIHWLDIACVHRDIPKDLTLSTEEHCHSFTPHLVVLSIEVWRTQTPFPVRHLWILYWLESFNIRNLLSYHLKDQNGEPERGSEWEMIKNLFKNSTYEPYFTRVPPQASLAKSTQSLEFYWS